MSSWQGYLQDPDLSEATQNAYKLHVQKLLDYVGKPVEWVLSHPKEVLAMMDNDPSVSNNTKRNRICAVCSLLKRWTTAASELAPERDVWMAAHKSLNKEKSESQMSGDPSEKELVNWVPWDKVLKAESVLAKTEFASLRHLVLSMYTHIEPVRADYGRLRLFWSDPPVCDADQENYVFISPSPGKSVLCLNRYKTVRRYGKFTRSLPESLVAVIRKSVHDDPRDYLFVTIHGEPYNLSNSFVKFVNRVLYDIFKKHMTISLMRHSFISAIDFNNSRPGDLIQVSKNMMHSVQMQQMYRRIVPEMEVQLEKEPRRKKKKKGKKSRAPPPPQPQAPTQAPTQRERGPRMLYV